MVNWTMFQARHANGTVATYKGMQPTKVQIRACYSLNTSVDRAWRRKNKPYPRVSQDSGVVSSTCCNHGQHMGGTDGPAFRSL